MNGALSTAAWTLHREAAWGKGVTVFSGVPLLSYTDLTEIMNEVNNKQPK